MRTDTDRTVASIPPCIHSLEKSSIAAAQRGRKESRAQVEDRTSKQVQSLEKGEKDTKCACLWEREEQGTNLSVAIEKGGKGCVFVCQR